MRQALNIDKVRTIYNRSYKYYDLFHKLGTFKLDERGRDILVDKIVNPGDYILDAGGGTGSTAIKAVKKAGEDGRVIILDLSENMLKKAIEKATAIDQQDKITTKIGDMYEIPFPDETFDAVISTYSTCPLENPIKAVKEMLRVLKKDGLLGIAHSSEPDNKTAKWLSDKIESIIWKFPRLSLGCRNIQLIEDIKKMDVEIMEDKIIGFIPWYFRIIIVKK